MRADQKTVDFYQMVFLEAEERGSLYSGNRTDMEKLARFMDMNDWFGMRGKIQERSRATSAGRDPLMIEDRIAGLLVSRLKLWLDAYGRSNCEKLELLARHGSKIFPETASGYASYIREAGMENEISAWQLLDYLLAELPKELADMSQEETERLLDGMDKELPLVTVKLFARFYEDMQARSGRNGWVYRFHSRNGKMETGAYSLRDFSRMAYCVFNEECWRKNFMVEKACSSGHDANLWIFIAMHFVCGMRGTDIVRIPKPELPCCGEEFRKLALEDGIDDPGLFSRDIQLRMRYKTYHPHKTAAHPGVPEIKLFIPASLEKPLGMILAVAASHCDGVEAGGPFIRADRSIVSIRKFFGEAFADALHGKNFASRKANKSYLQGIELVGGLDDADAPKGYMVAALARSHKGGIGTLPDITEIYLKDAAFSGYTPEFIAREMFERGVFGFIPHILLEAYAGEGYRKLNVGSQTELIRQIGISPSGIEKLAGLADRSFMLAKESVAALVDGREKLFSVLQRIAAGAAAGKDKGSLCLMTACGYSCQRPESAACIGCRYEIFTKAVMHHLVKEYIRMRGKFADADGWRYKEIIKSAVLPMAGELLKTVREMYPDADMELMTEIMEGGMNGYDGCGQSGRRDRLQQVSCGQQDR